jgi:hypothetical protein
LCLFDPVGPGKLVSDDVADHGEQHRRRVARAGVHWGSVVNRAPEEHRGAWVGDSKHRKSGNRLGWNAENDERRPVDGTALRRQ